MILHLSWQEISIRLILTICAGALIGLNREEQGRPAGLRTTILVCVAASAAMIQANLLLGLSGRTADSFIMLDLMRLPLGILSGMGFIGAGAILRREESVRGVTTAATLWFTTVMGLCFGGGQIGLGLATLAIGFGTLAGLKLAERKLRQDRHATLSITTEGAGVSDQEIRSSLSAQGYKVTSCSVTTYTKDSRKDVHYEIQWRGLPGESAIPSIYETLSHHSNVSKVEWHP